MRFLSLAEVLELHRPFGGQELHEMLSEKAAALGCSLISNQPFVDGNKRTGHAAMETFLILNGYEIGTGVDESERMVLAVAAGREQLAVWLQDHLRPL